MPLVVGADLTFEVSGVDRPAVHGRLRGSGSILTLEVDDPGAFAGAGDAPAVRSLAESLARYGVVIGVVHDGELLVTLGAVSAPWWQRRLTGSRRIRLGSVRGAWTAARARARASAPVLPGLDLVPPATLFPVLPTFLRRVGGPTTTHDPDRGGRPHLVLVREHMWAGERQPVFWLGERTTFGSDPDNDVVLSGLAPRHAVVLHDEQDEFVIHALDGMVRVHGAAVPSSLLRTGTRTELGELCFAFSREESADHGRPHGGRLGGEIGHQLRQPPRDAVRRPETNR